MLAVTEAVCYLYFTEYINLLNLLKINLLLIAFIKAI